MNLGDFLQKYKGAIANRVIESYPPLFQPAESKPLPRLLRRPLGAQANAIAGAALSLQENLGTTVVGEMGTGKTFIATGASYMAGFRRVLVVCPPHLTGKWKREIEETLPVVHAAVVKSITDLERIRNMPTGAMPQYVILSREQAKLTYRWKPAYIEKKARGGGQLLRTPEEESYDAPHCPTCNRQIVDKDGIPLTFAVLNRRKHTCPKCKTPLWQADNAGPRRYALADYIKKHMKGYFDLAIFDEAHEFKGRGSAQGIAAGILAQACGQSLSLTGTLLGGYSSTIFHLLYRFSPKIREEFKHNEEGRWIKHYGFEEVTVNRDREDDDREDGRNSKRRNHRRITKEKPGLVPTALFHIINNTVFLKLADVASDLPAYNEEIRIYNMDPETDETGFSQASAYYDLLDVLYDELRAALLAGSRRMLATYLQTLLAYPDGCTRGETLIIDKPKETEPLIIQVPPLNADKIYPKEKELIELVKQERAEGRRVLVYATNTEKRDITQRLQNILAKEGYNVGVMKAQAVPPKKREAWVAKKVKEGIDVMICHPRLVQTGLDLIDFPTIIWSQTDYSVYVMRQASRRSWRIGQTRPVKIIYLTYASTLQAEALKLVAQKLQSSLAVEGDLPEDGLAAYGDNGDDLMMALARKIVNASTEEHRDSLEDVINATQKAIIEEDELLVSEDWTPIEAVEPAPQPAPAPIAPTQPVVTSAPHRVSWEEFLKTEPVKQKKTQKKAPDTQSMSMFDFALELEQQPELIPA